MENWYNAFKSFLVSFMKRGCQFEKGIWNCCLKFLPHLHSYKERVTCIITTETVMCIIHSRKYHLHNCNRESHAQLGLRIQPHYNALSDPWIKIVQVQWSAVGWWGYPPKNDPKLVMGSLKKKHCRTFSSSLLPGMSPALFQNIFKFYIFLSKYSNILPLFNTYFAFFAIFLKNHMHTLSF